MVGRDIDLIGNAKRAAGDAPEVVAHGAEGDGQRQAERQDHASQGEWSAGPFFPIIHSNRAPAMGTQKNKLS